MVQITLVGERQAQVGHQFVYRGPQPECGPCRVRSACLNQDVGRRYRVVRVRDVAHACLLNEERARVVEVDASPPPVSLPTSAAVEGALVAYERIVCANAACPNYRTCHPIGVDRGTKLKVLAVGPELECPIGYALSSATVTYAD